MSAEHPEGGQNNVSVYNRLTMPLYDWYVLGLSSNHIWNCPREVALERYQRNVGSPHLEVGVGSAWFLDNVAFPTDHPDLVLADLQQHCLRYSGNKLARHNPKLVQVDVTAELPFAGDKFKSIGMNYVLHCLPGDQAGTKWQVFSRLGKLLDERGVLFGGTILGQGVETTRLQRGVMSVYNNKGVFGNEYDSYDGLEAGLNGAFHNVEIDMCGPIAFFEAHNPR